MCGLIFALNIVQGFFQAGIYRTALIIGAETLSKVTDWSDRGTCVLFGDGAGAAVLRAAETGVIDMTMGSDGTKGSALACTSRTLGNFLTGTKPEIGFMTMDGREVFSFAVRKVPESVEYLLEKTKTVQGRDQILRSSSGQRADCRSGCQAVKGVPWINFR